MVTISSDTLPSDLTTRLAFSATMRSVLIQLGAGSVPLSKPADVSGTSRSACGRDVTGRAIKSPYSSAAVRTSTGPRLVADRSLNENGTSNNSPRLSIVPNFILGVIPHRRERTGLRAHQIAPSASLASLPKKADEIEHLARERFRQRLDLLINQLRDAHALLLMLGTPS